MNKARNSRLFCFLTLVLVLCAGGAWGQITINGSGSYPDLQSAVTAANPGNVIDIPAGTFTIPSSIDVNKANLTIQGAGNTLTKLQVSGGTGSGDQRINVNAANITFQNLEIEKTDKAGMDGIIRLTGAASNAVVKNNRIHGQFVIGDGEVVRAIVVNAGALTGVNIEGNEIFDLRQPAYVSGTHSGTIQNNYVYKTKGWVLEGGNFTFTGNTWGTGANANVYDIAILSGVNPAHYSDIVAMSNANSAAVIEDQRVSPAVLSVVYVDASTSFTSDLGGRYHPYSTITPATTRAVAGGTINVGPGTYSDYVTLTKSVLLKGANAGIHPAVGTHPTEIVGTRGAETVVSSLSPAADNITVDGFTFEKAGTRIIDTYANANYFTLKNCIVRSTTNGATTGVTQFGGGSHTNCVFEFNLFTDKGDHTFYAGGGPYDGLTFRYNKFNAEGDAIFWSATSLVDGVIEGNEFDGTIGGTPGTGYCEMNIGLGGNIAIRKNWFHDQLYTSFQIGIIGGSITENTFERVFPLSGYGASAFELWGGQWGTAVSTNVLIENNTIKYNDIPGATLPSHGARLRAPESGSGIDGSTIHFHNNNFLSGNIRTDAYAIRHQGNAATSVDATCNWWGTTDPSAIIARMSGSVNFIPFLSSMGGPCNGGPVQVTRAGTVISAHATIQGAIDASTTLAGDVINVAAGTYYEHDITINKSLTLTGDPGDAQPGPGPNAPIVDGQGLYTDCFLLANGTSNVTIQGFEIRNYVTIHAGSNGEGNAIQGWVNGTDHITVADNFMHDLDWNGVLVGNDNGIAGHSYWTVARNILTDFGPAAFATSGYGIEVSDASHVVIEDNIINAGTGHPGCAVLIHFRGTYGEDILIRRNQIRGQYDFAAINVQASTDYTNPSQLDNVDVLSNDVEVSGSAYAAVQIRNKLSGSVTNATVSDNRLIHSGGYAVRNWNVPGSINATCNWYGTAVLLAVAAKIDGNVTYLPFLLTSSGSCAIPPVSEVWVDDTWAGSTVGAIVGGTHVFGADAFATIPEGVTAVTAGGRVNVAAGTYYGGVTLNKQAILVGAGSATTIVNAGVEAHALNSSVAGSQISGFTWMNAQNGVVITGNNTRLRNCAIHSTTTNGVLVNGAMSCLIQGNTINGNPSSGVALVNAKQNTITGNTFGASSPNGTNVMITGSGVGSSRNNLIQANTFRLPTNWNVYVDSDPLTTKVNFNVFNDTRTPMRYIHNSSSSELLNAEWNWFDGVSSPDASGFEGSIDYAPAFATNPSVTVLTSDVYIPVGSDYNVVLSALIPAGTIVKGATMVLNWTDDTNIPDQGDPLQGSIFMTGESFYDFEFGIAGNSVTVDQALLSSGGIGNPTGGLPYVGTLFTQTFHATAEGNSQLTLSTATMRDPSNNPIPVDKIDGYYLRADGTPPTVAVTITNSTTTNNSWVKNSDELVVTANVVEATGMSASQISGNLNGFYGGSGHATDNPASFASPFATWTTVSSANCNPTDGPLPITITVTATDLAGNVGTGTATIMPDNTAPTAPTVLYAKTTSPGGHQKTQLSWTAGTDLNYKGVVIRYNAWNYPEYNAAEPVYPALPTAGTAVSATPILAPAVAYTHEIVARDIRYYSIFAVDQAGNYSPLDGTGTDRAANYFLGDLGSFGSGDDQYLPGSGGYDGSVEFADLTWFSNAYFTTSASWNSTNQHAQIDFGPTTTNKTYATAGHRFGIPDPDQAINFEDLMIFAMNYMNTMPKITVPADRQIAQQFAVELMKSSTNDMLTATVRVANDGREIKGVATTLNFDPAQLQFVDVVPGGLFGSEQQGLVLAKAENNKLQIDAAVLGIDRTIDFSGTLAVARFRILGAGQGDVTIDRAIVRNGENNEEIPVLNNNARPLPTVFNLAQNYPNPFNPTTRIDYQVPATSLVTVDVYNVLGERVVTLVNEVKEQGYYTVVWDGRNASNQQVASGLYFYTMRAGEFKNVKKMMLVK